MTEEIDYKAIKEPVEGNVDWSPFYAGALKNIFGPVEEMKPQPGYYRIKQGDKWCPVGFWTDKTGKVLLCWTVDGNIETPIEQAELWLQCAKKPVLKSVWYEAANTGRWSDASESITPEETKTNFPRDPFEALIAEVNGKLEHARGWLKQNGTVKSKADADHARNVQAQLMELVKRAKPMHEAEKKPFLEGGRAVDGKYRFRDDLEAVAKMLEKVWQQFARAEQIRIQKEAAEAERKRVEAERERQRIEAERQRIEAERLELEQNNPAMAIITPPEPLPELPPPPPPPAPIEKVMIGGGVGNRRSVTRTYEPIIQDYRAALNHYAEHPTLVATLEKLIAAELKQNKQATRIPGVDVFDDLGTKVWDSQSKPVEVAA